MTNFEMVETLREKANISYEEAKQALERSNWDLLDAMLLLEKEGKVNAGGGSYTTRPAEEKETKKSARNNGQGAFHWLGQTFCKLVRMGNVNFFVVSRSGKELFSLPVTVFVVLMILGFWFLVAALVIGLFCGLRYAFRGPNLGRDSINNAINRAADMAENVKEELRSDKSAAGEQENGEDEAN